MKILLLILLAGLPVVAAPLRDQLAMATEDADELAQIEIIRRLLAEGDKDPDLRRRLVDLWILDGDFDMAGNALAEWRDAPAGDRARIGAAILAERDEKPGEAFRLLAGHLRENPGDDSLILQAVGYGRQAGDIAGIASLLSDSGAVAGNPELLLARAQARRQLGLFSEALADFAAAEALAPDEKVVADSRASFERLKVAAGRLAEFQGDLTLNADDFPAQVGLAYWLLQGDANAKEALSVLRRTHPESIVVRLLDAHSRVASGEWTADAAIAEAGVITSGGLPTWKSIEALVRCDTALQAQPGSPSALAARAYVLNDDPAQYRLGLEDARAALRTDPSQMEALAEEIYALVKLQDFRSAIERVPRFESLNPPQKKLANVLSFGAEAAFQSGRLEDALTWINRAIALQPTPPYYRQRAAIFQRLGRTQEAERDQATAAKTR